MRQKKRSNLYSISGLAKPVAKQLIVRSAFIVTGS